ncbi:Nitrogen permease reactivator protein, partial [Bulinus truncatus]
LSSSIIGAIAGILGVLSFTGVTVAALLFRAWRKQYEHDLWWWKINFNELTSTNWSGASTIYSKASLRSLAGSELADVAGDSKLAVWKVSIIGCMEGIDNWLYGSCVSIHFKSQIVRLRKLPAKYVHINATILEEFKMLRDLSHANIIHIHGACIEVHIKLLVTEPCIKGSLGGLCYIHDSAIKYHGRLTSEVCLIDNRFSVKLADFGLPSLFHESQDDVISQEYKHDCMWKAPEVLKSGSAHAGSKEADVYSFAIILQEILTKDAPYSVESAYMTTDEIISKVVAGSNPPFRPTIELPNSMLVMTSLIENCWSEDPKQRPTSRSVRLTLKKIATSMGETGHLMDDLMRRMEMYATNLEKMVDEKTRELREEKKKSEQLLDQILPRSVADCLKAGQRVEPQAYECVTIYFSDIVGFTTLSGKSSPMEVVDLLNDLYSCFDSTIEAYDVYKVETIGDAYMVVSGLPQRNGNLHVVNIAKMSISVLENIKEFKIRHLPEERLQIRIGLHSGPVCAGVVGLKMPRYCLFGDTVNTASRMESYGKAMMIHISPSCKVLLDQFGAFHTKPRGRITIKGKGDMFTYWLVPSSSMESNVMVNIYDSTHTWIVFDY